MDIKINNSYISHFEGPSQNYYQAQERFNEILQKKLGVFADDMPKTASEDERLKTQDLKENDEIEKNAKDIVQTVQKRVNSPIFETDNNIKGLSRDSFTSSKPLNISTGSVFMNGIIDTNDIRKRSNLSSKEIDEKLKSTPLYGLGEDFKKAEDLYGVNSIIMLAISKLESDYGRSRIAQDKNNLFGYGAYDGRAYESAKSYNSKQESIYDLAKLLSEKYLRQGAPYFKGYSIDDVGKSYCTTPSWANEVKRISRSIAGK